MHYELKVVHNLLVTFVKSILPITRKWLIYNENCRGPYMGWSLGNTTSSLAI